MPPNIPAGGKFFVTITARDANFNTITSYNGTVALSATIGFVIPSSVDLKQGTATMEIYLDTAGTGIQLYALGAGKMGISTPLNVTSGTVYGSLSGKVTDGQGIPLVGAIVQFSQFGVNILPAPITNDKGGVSN
jgi:hypothetical protein